jgi:hypothetical protein
MDMSEPESKPNGEAIVYFVISPHEGPAYRICGDDELQALGGVHALERHLENQSYWFVTWWKSRLSNSGMTRCGCRNPCLSTTLFSPSIPSRFLCSSDGLQTSV